MSREFTEAEMDFIAFAKARYFFRLKPENREARLSEICDEYNEISPGFCDETTAWELLHEWEAAEYERKQEAEREKIAKRQAKEAKEAAKPTAAGNASSSDHIQHKPAGRYVLTVAQNNTYPDASFLASLETYCEEMGAELLIARCHYNKGAFAQPAADYKGDDVWFAKELEPYLVDGHIDLGGVHFVANANVIPTARNPISGFEAATGAGESVIVPATKIQLEMIARLKGQPAKAVTSTGAVTQRNYILRKAGTVASYEHNIGAIFVDTETGEMRHLEQMEGCEHFYDNGRQYSADGVLDGDFVEAYQPGDIHAEKMTKSNLSALLDRIDRFNPENVILHDLLDFSSRNHHNIKDNAFMFAQAMAGNTVEADLRCMASICDNIADRGFFLHVVESNHDMALEKWTKETSFKSDPVNALTYLYCVTAQYKAIAAGQDFNMLEYAYENIADGQESEMITFHSVDEPLVIAGVEMGVHGHNGCNGARGNPKQFRKLGVAMNTGHTHSPSIWGKVWTAGVAASLEMGYNIGPSSWALADLVTYDNGQRQIIFA